MTDLWQLSTSFRISQAVYVAATLGIADLVGDDARSVDELAGEPAPTPTRCTACYARLRALAFSTRTSGAVSH